MALTFQKGENDKIYITKLTRNTDKAVNVLSVNDVEYYNDYFVLDGGIKRNPSKNLPSDLVIPSTYKGQEVVRIAADAFMGCTDIERIIIPNSITSIGSRAFMNCTNLFTVSIPDGVANLFAATFGGCTNLSVIVLPATITSIGYNAFNGCTNLAKVYFKGTPSDWVKITIDSTGNEPLQNATIYYYSEKPNTEEIVADYWHYVDGDIIEWGSPCENGHTWVQNCTSPLTCSVCGATKGEPLGKHTWSDWKITKRQNCTEAGEKKRTCLVCGEQDIKLCGTPIGHDYGDEEIVITPSCKQPDYTKQECLRCGKKHYVYGEEKAHTWGEWFTETEPTEYIAGVKARICDICGTVETERIPALGTLELTLLEDGTYSVRASTDNISEEIIIPSTHNGKAVTQIADYGFENCVGIRSVTLPDGIRIIGDYAFAGCSMLGTVNISENSQLTTIGDEAFYEVTEIVTMFLPDSLTTIGDEAFALSSIETLVIPDNVTHIGYECFKESGLRTITFGSNSKLSYINDYAFMDCYYLTGIEIPDSVIDINERAFYGCKNLGTVKFGNNLERIWDRAFAYSGLTTVTIPEGCRCVYDGAFSQCTNLAEINLPSTLVAVGEESASSVFNNTAYYNDENNWVDGVLYIGEWLIDIKSTVAEVEVASSCSSISAGITSGRTLMAIIKIPLNVMNIQPKAFTNADNVTIYCEATSKPDGWADDWCDENVEVVWGYTEEGDSCSHKYGGYTITATPTCTRFGSMQSTCSICGEVEMKPIPPLGHNYEEDFTEPTCTEKGSRTYTCSRCGHSYTEEIEAVGHSWSDWDVVLPAECEIDGMRERKCNRCGEIETEIIAALGHMNDVETIESTCTEGGYTKYTCIHCGRTYNSNFTDPLGHFLIDGVCVRCGHTEKSGVYYGVSAIPERYNSSFILGLEHQVASNTHLESITATPLEGQYIYYCAPTSFGDCAFAYNNFVGGFTLIIEGISVTNAGGKTEAYNIYKSNQANLGADGAITITIKGTG